MPAEIVLSLARSSTATNRDAEVSDTARFKGYLSGIILMHIVARSQHEETRARASLLDSCRMVDEGLRSRRERRGSISNLRQNVWSPYKTVAHLWAAAITRWDQGRDWWTGTEAGLREFLQIAEAFRHEGEAFKPVRAHAPILDPETTWKVPPELLVTWPRIDLRYDDPDAWDLRKTGVKRRN